MRTTSSFEIFPNEPSERVLARARWLRSEHRIEEAVAAYREAIAEQPTLRTAWTECFEVLRAADSPEDALTLANRAARAFPTDAFPLALKGAALIELKQFRQAFETLQEAVERDPGLALTWHELGYAAYRLGEGNRALLALDQAFALEPHTETLVLRGRILRDAGEFFAAEVAFEGALHSAAHENQQEAIQHQIHVTRRLGGFPPDWVRELTAAERWFAEHGTVVVSSVPADAPPSDHDMVAALAALAYDRGWEFGQILTEDEHPEWPFLARQLGSTIEHPSALNMERIPLLVAVTPKPDDADWLGATRAIRASGRGASVVLRHPLELKPEVDIVGCLEENGAALQLAADPVGALVMAQHPAALMANRALSASPSPAGKG